jgi:hypothetical protein
MSALFLDRTDRLEGLDRTDRLEDVGWLDRLDWLDEDASESQLETDPSDLQVNALYVALGY